MGFEWMLTLSNKEKKQYSYKTVPLDIIDQLFRKKNDRDLDPPVSWRDSAVRIREFRRHGKYKQRDIVALEEKRGRERKQQELLEMQERKQQELLEMQDAADYLLEMIEQQELEEQALPIVLDYEETLPCSGILLNDIIKARRKPETAAALTNGFRHLVGNAIGNLGYFISHDLPQIWPDALAVRGFVLASVYSNVVQWVCEETVMGVTAQLDYYESAYLLRHPECTFVRTRGQSTCTACCKSTPSLIRRCESEASLRDGTIDLRKTPNARLVMSPGLSLKKLSTTSKELHNAQKQLIRHKQLADDYLNMFGQQVELRDRLMNYDLFSSDVEELGKRYLDKELIPEDHMAR
jgi:hypothetical protein